MAKKNKTKRRGCGARSGKQKDKEFAGRAMTGADLSTTAIYADIYTWN